MLKIRIADVATRSHKSGSGSHSSKPRPQGPCKSEFKLKVPAVQIQVQGPTQVGQNIPVQPLQQPVPIQPAPAGMVVPAPQIIYQNWIGKKPEFSGKPEEDAESHLLSTIDWMEAHNFPEGEKVKTFLLNANR